MRRKLHRFVCRILGHQWEPYFYPLGDGWFGSPHHRRLCIYCFADEADDTRA